MKYFLKTTATEDETMEKRPYIDPKVVTAILEANDGRNLSGNRTAHQESITNITTMLTRPGIVLQCPNIREHGIDRKTHLRADVKVVIYPRCLGDLHRVSQTSSAVAEYYGRIRLEAQAWIDDSPSHVFDYDQEKTQESDIQSNHKGRPDVHLYGPPQASLHEQRAWMALAAQKRRPPIARSFRKKLLSKTVMFAKSRGEGKTRLSHSSARLNRSQTAGPVWNEPPDRISGHSLISSHASPI
jgi:hypothetical protein